MNRTSVTRVLDLVQDFSGIPAEVLRKAADRGTAVHRHIELMIEPEELVEYAEPHPDLVPYIEAWRKWMDDEKLDVADMRPEVELRSKSLNLVGHVDYLIDAGGRSYLVDAKTTSMQAVGAYRYQLAGYAMLAKLMEIELDCRKCALLFLKKDGGYELKRLWDDEGAMNADIQDFMAIYRAFRIREGLLNGRA